MSTSMLAATAALLLAGDSSTSAPGHAEWHAGQPLPTAINSIAMLVDLELPPGPVDGEVLAYTLDILSRWSEDHPAASESLTHAVATDVRTVEALQKLAAQLRDVGSWGSAELCYTSGLALARACGARADADRCRKGLAEVSREPTRTGPTPPWSTTASIALLAVLVPTQREQVADQDGTVAAGRRRCEEPWSPHMQSLN
ncbi:MAG TPA: hypothetical protein VKB14_08590 [Actinomycetales bacterium]|nr:hypothetical protein [Actinomycetales bacterium]